MVLEIILERVTTSMGTDLDKVMEFEELPLEPEDAPSTVKLTGLIACAYRTLSGRGHQTRRKRRKREAGLSGHLEGQGQSRPRHKC